MGEIVNNKDNDILESKLRLLKEKPSSVIKVLKPLSRNIPCETINFYRKFLLRGHSKLILSVCGMMNSGKSSFLNALIKDTTNSTFQSGDCRLTNKEKILKTKNHVIIDSPGFDATDNDNHIAFDSFIKGDLHFFIHNISDGELNKPEIEFLKKVYNFSNHKNILNNTIIILTHRDEIDDIETVESAIRKQMSAIFNLDSKLICLSNTDYIEGIKNNEYQLVMESNFKEVIEMISRLSNLNKSIDELNTFRFHRDICLDKTQDFIIKKNKDLNNFEKDHTNLFNDLKTKISENNSYYIDKLNHFFSSIKSIEDKIAVKQRSIDSKWKQIEREKKNIRDEKRDRRYIERNSSDYGFFEYMRNLKWCDEAIRESESEIREYKRELEPLKNEKHELEKVRDKIEAEEIIELQSTVDKKLYEIIIYICNHKLYKDIMNPYTINNTLRHLYDILKEVNNDCCVFEKNQATVILHDYIEIIVDFKNCDDIKKYTKEKLNDVKDFIKIINNLKVSIVSPPISKNDDFLRVKEDVETAELLLSVI